MLTKVMTNTGVTKWGPGNFYETSLNFDGSTTGVSTPDSSDFSFGAGDFCMEAWRDQSLSQHLWYVKLLNYTDNAAGFFNFQ